jgi:hypothetical protein
MHQARSQRAQCLPKQAAHRLSCPDRRPGIPVDRLCRVRIAASQNRSLHENRPLRLRQPCQPVPQWPAPGARDQFRNFCSREGNCALVLNARTARIRRRQIGKRRRILLVHDLQGAIQHPLLHQPCGRSRIGTRVNFHARYRVFHQIQGFRLVAQHQGRKTVHLNCGALRFHQCFCALTRTWRFRHEYCLHGNFLTLSSPSAGWPSNLPLRTFQPNSPRIR